MLCVPEPNDHEEVEMDAVLKDLIERAGALSVARALVEGGFDRALGHNVTGKLAVNAKAKGYIAARAGGLADLWTAISRYEEEPIREVVVELLAGDGFERAVTDALRARCLADAARFIAELSVEGVRA